MKVGEDTACEYCSDCMEPNSCKRCKMVTKGKSWHQCPAENCLVKERLQDNCCESCWSSFLCDISQQSGTIKITSALTGDLIKEERVTGDDSFDQVVYQMARHLSLPAASLKFLNAKQIILSGRDLVKEINSKRTQLAQPWSVLPVSGVQKVMIAEVFLDPGVRINSETGKHECRKLPCGHLSCTLAEDEDAECVVCANIRERAAAKQRAKEAAEKKRIEETKAAEKKRIEDDNTLSDLKELQRVEIKSAALKTFIAQLAAKHPQGAALLQAEKNSLRTFKVTGENKVTIFAEPCVDSKKVGTLEPSVCFGVVGEKKSVDGRTYLRLNGGLGWTYTTSKKDVNKVVVCEVKLAQAGVQDGRPIPSPVRAHPEGGGASSAKRHKS